jgi:hypothetical protein
VEGFQFYSLLGALVYDKLIDVESVFHIIGSSYPRMLYEKLKPIVLGLRRDLDEPYLMAGFEYLCSELTRKEPWVRQMWKKREQKLQSKAWCLLRLLYCFKCSVSKFFERCAPVMPDKY